MLLAGVASAQDIRISEFMANAPFTDEGREYFEISGPAGASLDGLTILEIEGDSSNPGNIDAALDLTGLSLGSNGLLLLRDQPTIDIDGQTFDAVLRPFPESATNVFVDGTNVGDYNGDTFVNALDYAEWRDELQDFQDDDSGNADGMLGNLSNDLTPDSVAQEDYDVWDDNYGAPVSGQFFNEDGGGLENGSITFALVSGFTGARDDDIDTNDDGLLDSTPWTTVLDAVGFDEDGPTDSSSNIGYGVALGGVDFDGTVYNGTLDFFDDDPNGYVLLEDSQGNKIPAAFGADTSGDEPDITYDEFEIFFDAGGGNLQGIDTTDLGPFSVLVGADGSTPAIITVDGSGNHNFVDPDEVAYTGLDLFGNANLTLLDANGDPLEIFLLTPGSANGTATVGGTVVDLNPPAATTVPEPTATLLALSALMAAARGRRS